MTLEPAKIQGYCRFDIRIEFDNGNIQDIMDVNLCEALDVVTYGFDRQRNAYYYRVTYL